MRDEQGDHATLGEARTIELAELDVVLLRQDPPFDLAYIATTHLLERIHPKTLVVNDPRAVRDAPEKLFVMDFPELMPPTLISRERAAIEAFRAAHGEVVMKPLYGFGGGSVFKVGERDPNFGSLFDLFSTTFREPWVIQKFLPQVVEGDKRIILVDGEALGAVNRVPAERRHPLQHGARRRGGRDRADGARARDLRPHRPRIEAARPRLRRHRRDRRLADRNQRHLADRHPRRAAARRPRPRGGDLGRDRSEAARRRSRAMTAVSSALGARARRGRSAPADLFDRDEVETKLERLRAKIKNDEAAFRRGAVEVFAAALEAGRAEAQRALEEGGRGRACARALSDLEDEIIRAVHDMAVRLAHPDGAAKAKGLTILAVGGYGRGMLAPGSDIDLLFLIDDEKDAGDAKLIETILYVLWDLKQKVGHATRTIDECLRQARADMTIRTSVLEARLIAGDAKKLATLRARFDKEIVAKTASEFVTAKLGERDARVKRAGESRYLVEPNIKEGKGGLRDLNTLFWIAKYVYRVRDPRELVEAGLFSQREFNLFSRCEEFLWPVRCHLHFLTGHAEERLSFDVQRPIAERLGYAARAGQADVERFMKHYFLVAKDVGDLTAIVCAALEERQAKPTQGFDRFLGRLRRRPQALDDAVDFKIDHDRINVIRADAFERDPVNLIRLYLGRRPLEPRHPSGRDAARHPVAEAHRRRAARRSGGEPTVPRHPHLAPVAGNGAAEG